MPNVNDLTWYVQYGDPHFDGTTEWSLGGVKQRGGLWLKKWNKISSKPSDASITNCSTRHSSASYDAEEGFITASATPKTGRPADTSDYFFLPAMGYYSGGQLYIVGTGGYYWSSSPDAGYAYNLIFGSGVVYGYSNSINDARYHGYVAGSRPDGSPWFK